MLDVPQPEVQDVHNHLAALQVVEVPDDIRAILVAEAELRATNRLCAEILADADAEVQRTAALPLTKENIAAQVDAVLRATALASVLADRIAGRQYAEQPATPDSSPFAGRAGDPQAARRRDRWPARLLTWLNQLNAEVQSRIPAAPVTRYQQLVADYEWLSLEHARNPHLRKPTMPRSCDADIVATRFAEQTQAIVTAARQDNARLIQEIADLNRTGAMPVDLVRVIDHNLAESLPELERNVAEIARLIEIANTARVTLGLDDPETPS